MLGCFSRVSLFAILWTVAHQAPLSIEFSRQEYWSGLPCPPPGNPSCPEIEPVSLAPPTLQANSLQSEPPGCFKPLQLTRNSARNLQDIPICPNTLTSYSVSGTELKLRSLFIVRVTN